MIRFIGSSGGSSSGDKPPTGDTRMAYSFDSAALERAAQAAKDLEKNPNAKQLLELSKQQEITRQKEFDSQSRVG